MEENKGFTQKHVGVWQFIKFTLVSSLAGITETVSFFILSTLLGTRLTEDFDFFVFHYTAEKSLNLGLFIAFFASAILAEIVSFLINRKATFHANNNFFRSAVMYLILVLAVISLKTWIVGQQLDGHPAFDRVDPESGLDADRDGDHFPDEQVRHHAAYGRARRSAG